MMLFVRSIATCVVVFVAAATSLHAADLWQLSSHALADYKFEGVSLGDNVAELRQQVPTVQFAYDKVDAQAGIEAYTVVDINDADGACFYFFRDSLYQLDIEYKKDRVESLGGLGVILRNLIAVLGPADYADSYRHTWHQPNCRRRADLYISNDTGLLVITDTSRSVIADQRLREAAPDPNVKLGF